LGAPRCRARKDEARSRNGRPREPAYRARYQDSELPFLLQALERKGERRHAQGGTPNKQRQRRQ
jgi:hypothetical protein